MSRHQAELNHLSFKQYRSMELLPVAILLLFTTLGCVNHGDLRPQPLPTEEVYTLAGTVATSDLVEKDLLASRLTDIAHLTDFTTFEIVAGNRKTRANKDGTFTLSDIPFSSDLVVTASASKVIFKLRLYPADLRTTDVKRLAFSVESTVAALIWERAHAAGTELTEADIAAREYVASTTQIASNLRLALQMPKKSVPQTLLDLPVIVNAVNDAAARIIPRESVLTESLSVVQNIFIRRDLKLLENYISPDFGNDWDTTSSYNDCLSTVASMFKQFEIKNASYTIHQMEFLPGELARIRVSFQLDLFDINMGMGHSTDIYTSDVIWRREGTFWKIFRNLPYKKTDPTQVGADSRWGEIARAHAALQYAVTREEIATLGSYISENFGNDWDANSTKSDLLLCAKNRFLVCDVKIASYTIRSIDFIGTDLARVHCAGQVRVINTVLGIDIDWGTVNAVIEWRLEGGSWKLSRNLPYRLTHPRDIR
ncbi:MAG: hypothetical protein HQM09_02155 [Candidatus Riflebacteria bacterium]|nr:hypothetical protein [Candidatus Riflebacteria bacterium]